MSTALRRAGRRVILPTMDTSDPLDELLVCRLDLARRAAEPCTVVIFGASGDLTARKLIPAFYQLFREKRLPQPLRILGFARRVKSDDSWRSELRQDLEQFSRTKPIDEAVWSAFAAQVSYCQGDMADAAAYERLAARIRSFPEPELCRNLLFYLAIAPSQFGEAAGRLHAAGLLRREHSSEGWQRIIVEKPFGHDLASAHHLNQDLTTHARENQIFRIDHYLGKETVQNILMFRFSNAIFEPLWNRTAIDHVQLTVSERVGVGGRGGYYEEAGALRDMVQNHLLQVLALVAMEPPGSLDAEAIRDEKVKLLKAVRLFHPGQVAGQVVRGQYTEGEIEGRPTPGYRHEPKVQPASNVETFAAARLFIDNWRWSGVPFFVRTGKCLPVSASEVRVQFRPTPHVLFAAQCGPRLDSNAITLRLQPHEGISLRFNGKVPGNNLQIRPVRMHFSYDTEFGAYTPEAYEHLLLEAMTGDAMLFIRRDEVEAAWSIVDPIREAWTGQPLTEREFYRAGSWGPAASEELLGQTGRAWRNPQPSA